MANIVSKITGLVLSSVSTPATGRRVLYAKSDGWYDKNSAGTETKLITEATTAIEKVYRAFITQASTDAPTVTVLENTLSGAIVWTYTGVGVYTGTLAGAFLANKVVPKSGHIDITAGDSTYSLTRGTDNTVVLRTFSDEGSTAANDELTGFYLEIIVWP